MKQLENHKIETENIKKRNRDGTLDIARTFVKEKHQNRIIYFDVLNIIACIAVCYLHCNGEVHVFSNSRLWKESLIIEVLCYFAVPIFIMLSGATLLKYRDRYTTKQYFIKRIQKVLIPWVIWSLITYIVHNKNVNLLSFFNSFIYGKIEAVYWFFPLIIYLYCIIPVISILTQKEEYRKIMWGIVIFIFLIQSLLQPLLKMMHISFPIILNYMTGQNAYIIYLLLGYLLSTTNPNKRQRIMSYILAIIAVFTRYLYTMFASINTGKLNQDSWGYTAFTGVFLAVGVFILAKNIDWIKIFSKLKIKANNISNLASCSFGVYLIHILIRSKTISLLGINTNSYFSRLIFPIILYAMCVMIVYIIKKVPLLKKIVP